MNKTYMIGRLTADVKLDTTNSGISFAKFNLAVNRKFKKEDDEVSADFFNCISWRVQAENIAKYCHKGSKVAIVGELQTRSYDDKEGIKRYITEIIVNECEFLDSKSKDNETENTTNETAPKEAQPIDDKLPF